MRILTYFFIALLFFTSCKSVYTEPLEQTYYSRELQDDFDAFRNILESAHPGLYEYIGKTRMDHLFDSIKKTINDETNKLDFFNKLSFIAGKIGCTHTSVYFSQKDLDAIKTRSYFFPLRLIYIDKKLCVNSEYDALPKGSIIEKINQKPVDSILKQLLLYHTTDGRIVYPKYEQAAENFGFDYFLKFGKAESFEVQYRLHPDSASENKIIKPIRLEELKEKLQSLYYVDANDFDYDLDIDSENGHAIMVIRTLDFSSISRDKVFGNFMKNSFRLLKSDKNIKNLIIDLRQNGGGNYKNCFLTYSYLTDKPFREFDSVFVKFTTIPYYNYLNANFLENDWQEVKTIIDSEFTARKFGRSYLSHDKNIEWQPNENRFDRNVYVIVNSNVSSAAAYLAALLHHSGRATIIGEETEGGYYHHNGFHQIDYVLPNTNIGFSFSIANVKTCGGMNRPPNYGRGVIPDYFVLSSYEDFIDNGDSQIRFALDNLIKE